MTDRVEIVGAGPAGLAAALTLARGGREPIVYERHRDVGRRFHGDFQGLENWTRERDVLDELREIGVDPTFDHEGFAEVTAFGPEETRYEFSAPEPMWYLVRRGSQEGTLDRSLREQAEAAGVQIRFNTPKPKLPEGGIVAHGPHRADAIAVGYVFETDAPNQSFAAFNDDLAPKGYSYLLVCNGRATVAACLFDDFHNEDQYLERTLEFFQQQTPVTIEEDRRFGGFGNVFAGRDVRKGDLLYAGEAAGFQDALFGFGMRFAMRSGHLAAQSFLEDDPAGYDERCDRQLRGLLRRGIVNRYLYEKIGNRGYIRLLNQMDRADSTREWLRDYYHPGLRDRLLHPLAARKLRQKPVLVEGCKEGCTCTWCRCERQSAAS